MWSLTLLVIACMIALNGLFAGYEIALASVSSGRLDILAREGRRGAVSALRMKNNIEASLAVVQMGVTLAGAIAAAVGGAGAETAVEPYLAPLRLGSTMTQILAIAIVVVPLTAFTIVLGELVPKVFSIRHKEWVCLTLSPAMEWFGYAVWPAVWLFENSTHLIMSLGRRPGPKEQEAADEATLQELRAAAAVARTSRLISSREEGIIVGASELPETDVRDAMLPAEHISMLYIDDPVGVSLVTAHNDMHTRFPVTEKPGDPQGIVGYVNFKDIVASMRMSPDRPNVRGIVRPMPSFDAEFPLSQAMESLIQGHTHIALVRDPHAGRVIGMITLEDILEEFVGDIRDEYDRLPTYVTSSGNAWIAGGGTSLRALHAATRISLPGIDEVGSESLHAWMEHRLARRVRGGDVIRESGIRVLARKVRRGMLLEALIGPDAASTGQSTAVASQPL